MKRYKIFLSCIIISIALSSFSFAAVKINKDDAAQYSKKTDFATEIDEDASNNNVSNANTAGVSANSNYNTGSDEDKFSCKTADKSGESYVNTWSNYKIEFDGKEKSASQFYTFNDPDCKFDFGVYWPDWSRLAIYYTRLSRDIDEVARIFANKKSTPRNVVVGGEVYRYVQEAVEYPYGTEYYDYYLRNVDGKLMVIECFHENETDVAPTFIEKIEKNNG